MKLKKRKLQKYCSIAGIICASITLLFVLFYASVYFGLWGEVPSSEKIAGLKQSQATQILDKNKDLIGKLYIYDRQSIRFSDFPKHLLDALIATEDVRFYEHDGIDNKSLFRVFFKTILLFDESSGGGSTITLQLAKNLFGRDRSGAFGLVINKIKEGIVAKRIEKIYSKDEILTLYLNTVPFPDNTYGIESAAEKFFNVHTRELSVSQAATLIGSLKANHSYNPRLFPEKSLSRRNTVLSLMAKNGFALEKDINAIKREPLQLDYQYYAPNQGLAPYFRAEIKRQLDSILKQKKFKKPNGDTYNVYHDGLKIYTTLDNTLQRYAEEAMRTHMDQLQKQYENAYGKNAPWLKGKPAFVAAKKRLKTYKSMKAKGYSEQQIIDALSQTKETELFSWNGSSIASISILDSLEYYSRFLNAGMLSLEPSTGEVRVYVGGIDYRFFQYDHITQSKRQVGSTFKPIVYTAAIENGMDPCTYFPIKQVTYTDVGNWTPTNASNNEEEENLNLSLKEALSNSVNTIAVKVIYETGIDKTIEQAKKMGIKSAIEEVPSIALGSSNLSMMELAATYTTFVNESKATTPVFITRIEDKNGKLIAAYEDLNPKPTLEKAYSDNTRQVLLEYMKATVNDGTANRLRSKYGLNNAIAGKTGTTQDNKDGWFVGITPQLLTVTWAGNDNQQIGFSSTGIGQGANSALPMFALYLKKINADKKYNQISNAQFEEPSEEVIKSLDCDPTKTDGFFKRLFGGEKEKKTFEKKNKKGIFSWLKKDRSKKENE